MSQNGHIVRFPLETVSALNWNHCPLSIGMSVRFRLECAVGRQFVVKMSLHVRQHIRYRGYVFSFRPAHLLHAINDTVVSPSDF